jgi:hypothetical protein
MFGKIGAKIIRPAAHIPIVPVVHEIFAEIAAERPINGRTGVFKQVIMNNYNPIARSYFLFTKDSSEKMIKQQFIPFPVHA